MPASSVFGSTLPGFSVTLIEYVAFGVVSSAIVSWARPALLFSARLDVLFGWPGSWTRKVFASGSNVYQFCSTIPAARIRMVVSMSADLTGLWDRGRGGSSSERFHCGDERSWLQVLIIAAVHAFGPLARLP